MTRVAYIDNYDSFSYNIIEEFRNLNSNIEIFENKEVLNHDVFDYILSDFTHLVVGPGPGSPSDIMHICELIKLFKAPVFGVCLGHQSIAYSYGCKISSLDNPVHGKKSLIIFQKNEIFKIENNDLKPSFAGRYHSLHISELTNKIKVIAMSDDNVIMAIKHITLPMYGVQFHPESILSDLTINGKNIIFSNFLNIPSNKKLLKANRKCM